MLDGRVPDSKNSSFKAFYKIYATETARVGERMPGKREVEESDSEDLYREEGNKRLHISSSDERGLLQTIEKKRLDFYSEKVCSVTLSTIDVYSCLTCGKYLQGRNEGSPAFKHSIEDLHRLFMHMRTFKTYILPENRPFRNAEVLDQIRYGFKPTYGRLQVADFPQDCEDLNGQPYLNGFVGLHNISNNGSSNVILLMLAHIKPVRDLFLLNDDLLERADPFINKLALLIRHIWSPNLFRRHVSPHEFLQYVATHLAQPSSMKAYSDPRNFMLFVINRMLKSSCGEVRKTLTDNIQGTVTIRTTKIVPAPNDDGSAIKFVLDTRTAKSTDVMFWMLSLDLPPRPLFKDGKSANSLPQVKLEELMGKFDGTVEQHLKESVKLNKVSRCPRYLVLHLKRFEPGKFPVQERNQTVVEFGQELEFRSVKFRLLMNVVHEATKPAKNQEVPILDEISNWKIQIRNDKDDTWFELDEGNVRKREKELLFLNETYLQVWERVAAA
ncbi:FAGR007Cp [Eremothecium gossypii FDAG1]|nr:FAGR007Cp [Eremothecium gossypii FDAG1]